LKRCPSCGATRTASSEHRFCESDGATLVEVPDPARPGGPPCPMCSEGTVESDGFCSSCGKRALSSRPTPAVAPVGSPLAGGVVVSSQSSEEYVVRMPGGGSVLVALGDASAIEREADALERIGGSGPFPRVVECGADETHGAFLALAMPAADDRPLGEVGPGFGLPAVTALLRALLDAAQIVERMGFAWEPQRDDVHVRPDGTVRIARLRVPRKLGPSERLDARAVIESVGPTFVPAPAIEGPPRAFRLLLPHVAIPGDPGHSLDDARAELDAIERELAPPAADASRVAGVCDPGLRRPHNEDAVASASGITKGEPWTVLVVCDGVSSSSHAELASAVAAKTACDALAHFARSGDVAFEGGAAALTTAIKAAHVAVCAQGIDTGSGDPPGTTIVAGLLWRRRLTVGWVGDSRAYWVSEQGAELLTHDHSWANEAVARGEVTELEAALSPLAHALTRCLGPLEVMDPDAPPNARPRIQEVQPDVRARDLPGPGWIVLCSDGFWNYFSPATEVAALVRSLGANPSAPLVARRLVNHALVRGGQDNTTVLVHQHR
jgi:serine/threonine protein phosphatase PrpC